MEAPIKPYNVYELAQLYNISCKVMRVWLRKAGMLHVRVGYYFNVEQVARIFQHLGRPEIDNKPNQ